MLRKIVFIFLLLSAINVYGAFAARLENPPVQYFDDINGVKIDLARNIIIDGIDRSSSPKHVYTVYSDKPGHIVAKIYVNNKHTALVNIRYSQFKIEVTYHSSINLKYSKSEDGEEIHPRYMEWVAYMVNKITLASERATNITMTDISPYILAQIKAGKGKRIGVFAYGLYNKNTDVTSIRNSTEFSATISLQMKKTMLAISKIPLFVIVIPQDDQAQDFLTSSEQKTDGQNFCIKYKVDVLVIADIDDSTGGGGGSRETKMMNYNCKSKEIKSEQYYLEKKIVEKFPYQVDVDNIVTEFMDLTGELSEN